MIKIQQHLDRPDSDEYLDSLALEMWNELNKTKVDGEYRENSLIKKLEKLIERTDEYDYLINVANNNQVTLGNQKDFFTYLNENECAKLKSIIISRPEELNNLREEILAILNADDFYYSYNGGYRQTSFGKVLLEDLFNYDNFRKSPFCRALMLKTGYENITCPYCNDTRINIIDISGADEDVTLRAYLDLDHFFSKSQNPFFAISFYNLVPSCHSCNASEKGDKVFLLNTHSHPYVKSFNEIYKFNIDQDFFLNASTENIILENISGLDDFNSRDFKLQERYQQIHLDEVNKFIQLYVNYQNYINSPEFGFDYRDALLQNIPIESKLILMKPQGKLMRDVLLQIDTFQLIQE
ncbi:hypothetical protein [Flavobacterium hungaricum]|uniref:HNH endonuclease n=1 Tax=Flavobacterium hungaricum TaxID=2082725 RepID=A0ABR9TEU0_9FLAO|nr:hypothetical protein [Flavobacterium hungaricum]MBE8723399.1 hypothetical protein [Flavobacterium hungaricum]